MTQPFPPDETRQTFPPTLDKLFDRDPTVLVRIEPGEDFFDDDLSFGFEGGGSGGVARAREVGRVMQAVDGFDLGDGEIMVTVKVVQAASVGRDIERKVSRGQVEVGLTGRTTRCQSRSSDVPLEPTSRRRRECDSALDHPSTCEPQTTTRLPSRASS